MFTPQAPSLITTLGESLTPLEFTRLFAASPGLAREQRGNGDTVLVLPGLGAGNRSTSLLRGYLAWLGYAVHGWQLGRNTGDVAAMLPVVVEQLQTLQQRSGDKIHLIGWSLGGIVAREAARDNPQLVKQVISLGSPIVGGPKYTAMGNMYERQGVDVDAIAATIESRESNPIAVPVTSVYSKRDGIVGWQASIDKYSKEADHQEVNATHFGLGISPEVFRILARKLAQT
ncbi:MAG: alpha/beta hydrolase [Pseudomonadota bacterium]